MKGKRKNCCRRDLAKQKRKEKVNVRFRTWNLFLKTHKTKQKNMKRHKKKLKKRKEKEKSF